MQQRAVRADDEVARLDEVELAHVALAEVELDLGLRGVLAREFEHRG